MQVYRTLARRELGTFFYSWIGYIVIAGAVFLMGLEKNSDIVKMSSYAPLFFHVNDNAWPVNMIGFDNAKVFGRTSYYVNKMMSENRPDFMIDTRTDVTVGGSSKQLFCITGYDKKNEEMVLKVVNVGSMAQKAFFRFKGVRLTGQPAEMTELSHNDFQAENSLYNPEVVVPKITTFTVSNSDFAKDFPPYSLTIIRVKIVKTIMK